MDEIKDYDYTDQRPQRTLNYKLFIPLMISEMILALVILVNPTSIDLNITHYLFAIGYFGAAQLLIFTKKDTFFIEKK